MDKAFLEEFKQKHEKYRHELNTWNERLLESLTDDEWISLLKERSIAIRKLFAESNSRINELKATLPAVMSDEDADELYLFAYSLVNNQIDDHSFIIELCDILIPYFEKTGNIEKTINTLFLQGNEYAVSYHLTNDTEGIAKSLTPYKTILSYKDRFHSLTDINSKFSIIYSFVNYQMYAANFKTATFTELYELLKEYHTFITSPEFIEKEKDDEAVWSNAQQTLIEMIAHLLTNAINFFPLKGDDKKALDDFLSNQVSLLEKSDYIDSCSGFILRLLRNECDENIWLNDFSNWLKNNIPSFDFSGDPMDQMGSFMEYDEMCKCFVSYLKTATIPDTEKQRLLSAFLSDWLKTIQEIPYSFLTEMINTMLAEFFETTEPLLESFDRKKMLLMKLIIARQPITYIHSKMVATIAVRIATTLIDTNPEALAGTDEYPTANDILNNKENFLSYISDCGLLHDTGKCLITDIINRQDRSLTDEEFDIIKLHPKLGIKALNTDPDFKPYFDIILHHHTYYDGSKGYPITDKSMTSKYKFITDIITIADSLDAATDILGRNYTAGKSFDTVLKELNDGAGTRYNPELVSLISNNDALKNDLAALTSDGRFKIYKDVYKEIK